MVKMAQDGKISRFMDAICPETEPGKRRLEGYLCAYKDELEYRKAACCHRNSQNLISESPSSLNELTAQISDMDLAGQKDLCNQVKGSCSLKNKGTRCWATFADSLFGEAKNDCENGHIDKGYMAYFAARRFEIYGMSCNEIEARAEVLRREAYKLPAWRSNAVYALIGRSTLPEKVLTSDELVLAYEMRDEHFSNTAYKRNFLHDQLFLLGLLLLASLLWLILFSEKGPELPRPDLIDRSFLRALGFGCLGSVLSAAFSLASENRTAKIPEHQINNMLMIMRIFTGIGASAVTYYFLDSVLAKSMFSEGVTKENGRLFICCAAGFSERLLLKAFGSVLGDSEKELQKPQKEAVHPASARGNKGTGT